MEALLIILAAIVGLALLALIVRALWWFCDTGFPSIILFLMKHF